MVTLKAAAGWAPGWVNVATVTSVRGLSSKPFSGDAAPPAATAATFTVAPALLLAGLVSGVVPLTVAELAAAPARSARTTRVPVTVAPAGTVPRALTMFEPDGALGPWLKWAEIREV